MRAQLTLLRLPLLLSLSNVAYAYSDGVGYEQSKHEHILNNYVDDPYVRVELNLFEAQSNQTKMYGISPGVGYKPLSYKYFRLYLIGHVNAGITVSPATEFPQCSTNASTSNNGYPPVDTQIDNANNKVNTFDTSTCNSLHKDASACSPYGGYMYYDLGVEPTILLFNHISLNAYGGYLWPHGSHYMDIGDMDMHGPVARLGLSLEF